MRLFSQGMTPSLDSAIMEWSNEGAPHNEWRRVVCDARKGRAEACDDTDLVAALNRREPVPGADEGHRE